MTLSAQPPIIAEPFRTDRRAELQAEARSFTMDEVLPAANELDPNKGLIPQGLIKRLGEVEHFGAIAAPKPAAAPVAMTRLPSNLMRSSRTDELGRG